MENLTVRLFRFETVIAAAAVVAAALAANVYIPYAKRLFGEYGELRVFWEFKGRTAGIAERKQKVEREIRLLDSLFSAYDRGIHADEGTVMGVLYRSAETAGLKTSKVEIGERMRIADHYETSITVRGSGPYAAVGRFCEAIENMPAPARIRQVSAGAEAGGTVGAIIEFVIAAR